PTPDVGQGDGEEEEADGKVPCPPAPLKNCRPRQGISVLEKLVKTCPVWLQLGLGQAEAARILHRELAGMFLVRRDSSSKHLVLCVHFPSRSENAAEVLEYTIKEEKSILYLEGSVLVFEDIFRLIAFYCVSRDLLPFTLRLPQAILEASSFTDLETISNLGLGFWDSSLNPPQGSGDPAEPPRDPASGAPPASSLRSTAHYPNCSCEIELSVGSDRLWFVNPIFIEDCSSALPTTDQPPGSCAPRPSPPTSDATSASACPQSSPEFKGSLASLADSLGVPLSAADQDSYSTSSTEEELEQFSSPGMKKKPSMLLGKARHRLSFASFSSVFNAFLSNNRKLYKKLVELAQDKSSYFGSLVQDYKVYSLEMMARQTSSTEMLQEIRTMMTQLKSYLLQSTELKALVDPGLHSEEELEAIVESALYKCVLKPLKEAIDSCLHEIHSKDGSLQQLKENQLVILATTTTDLGVTTSVPEVPVMEKILQKFASMHKAYSPEKKIAILLKTCKLIYDSMALGNPGKPYGADDFLPVLMYVLARSNLTELLLNVEYMMELMDPALQLGEGSYYLTTTYGALEHIKNYDKITVTRQLSVEVQDSIHRWERRRTLNKARASRSSVQDFICVSYLEPEQQSRTLASRADTPAQALCEQCAEKFEVAQPQAHRLFVLVDGRCFQLADEALPHRIKGYLLRSEPKRDFHFVYGPLDSGGGSGGPPCLVVREPNFL
ncbi:Ras and Rab interactor 3, partial [Tupaia chinensis]